MAVYLDEGAGDGPDPVGQIGGNVPDEKSPYRGVQGRPDEKPHEPHTYNDTRKREGQEAERFQYAGGHGAQLHDDVGHEDGQGHPQGGSPDAKCEAVFQCQYGYGVLEYIDPVLPAHTSERPGARGHDVGEHGGVKEDHHRQNDEHEGQQPDDGEHRVRVSFQVDESRLEPAACHGDVLAAFRGEIAVQVDQDDGRGQGAHADGGSLAVIGGKPGGDRSVDVSGQNILPARHPDDRGNGKGGKAPDDDEDHRS